jgi:uncharacterized alkaline shock family protein YloU
VTDFSTDGRPMPNGPSPFPGRSEDARPVAAGAEVGGAHRVPVRPPEPGAGTPRPAPGPAPSPRPEVGEVKGRIRIADEVVEKIAGLAATEVPGVVDLGGDLARAVDNVRERVAAGATRGDLGVKAEIKGQEVAIGVTVMVEFGYVVMDVARQVQANVAVQTRRMLGLRVVEVNVTVDDVRTGPPPEPGEGGRTR